VVTVARLNGSATCGVALPARYAEDWRQPFIDRALSAVGQGARVLEVGAGCTPAIGPSIRPVDWTYVALDVSQEELDKAPAGSYDATIASDIASHTPELDSTFDLIVSWQALEHVRHVDRAIANLRSYLRPQGRVVIQLSSSYSAFALLNRALPNKLGARVVSWAMDRPQTDVFSAHYHRCHYASLKREFAPWSSVTIMPRFRGAEYFTFSPLLQSLYIAYEDWAARKSAPNLATHYLIDARK
jgi:SAM-dependent methyltransferase